MMKDKSSRKRTLIAVIFNLLLLLALFYVIQDPLKKSDYDVEVTDKHVIIDLHFTATNHYFNERYAIVNYEPVIYEHAIDFAYNDSELLAPFASLHGSYTIYLIKEDMNKSTIEKLKKEELDIIRSVSLTKQRP